MPRGYNTRTSALLLDLFSSGMNRSRLEAPEGTCSGVGIPRSALSPAALATGPIAVGLNISSLLYLRTITPTSQILRLFFYYNPDIIMVNLSWYGSSEDPEVTNAAGMPICSCVESLVAGRP